MRRNRSVCGPYFELIAEALNHGRNAVALGQELVDDCGAVARV